MPAVRELSEYETLFAPATAHHQAVGEASTHYLRSRVAVPAILDYSPQARFIVCLRNPVDMAPALHNECLRQGWETVRSFEAAWRLQPRRRAGKRIPRTVKGDPERLQYGWYCRLGEQLERLYGWAPRQRVLPVVLDDLRADPATEYRRTLDFLGLEEDGRRRFPTVNATRRVRSPTLAMMVRRVARARDALGLRADWGIAEAVRRLNAGRTPMPEPSPALRDELRDYFRADVDRLGDLLDRDLSSWLKPGAVDG